MTDISPDQMSPAELAALLSFYADAGVGWLVEDEPVDRIAEFESQKAAQEARRATPSAGARQELGQSASASAPVQSAARPPANALPSVAIPDEHAVTDARFAAESARSLEELRIALEGFAGCNLKTSARSTIFAKGDPTGGIMVIGGMPSGDDDRDGQPFAGRAGLLLDRMLQAIGLQRDNLLTTTIVPWRPPGDRPPTPMEAAICRPFIERQIELAEPKAVLLLGNFTVRFFFPGNETIHALRGRWQEIACNGHTVPGLACLHPLELLAAPAGKALAWQDLQAFRRKVDGQD